METLFLHSLLLKKQESVEGFMYTKRENLQFFSFTILYIM